MTAPLAEQVAAALGEHALRETDPACACGWDWDWREVIMPSEVDFDPSRYRLPGEVRPVQHHAHAADAVLQVVAEWLGSDEVVEVATKELEATWYREDWTDEAAATVVLYAACGALRREVQP